MECIGVLVNDNYEHSYNYEKNLSEEIKKSKGIYYTPKFIVDYILNKTLKEHDILSNPCPKILDISCGCGNFLLEAYDILYEMFEYYRHELKIENIHKHIIENCIYGVDIDKNAVDILNNSLRNKDIDSKILKSNIYCFDSLNKNNLGQDVINLFWENKFDYIIGNPPYIGHKSLGKEYKNFLLKEYSEVYRDKSDIYYCFYKRVIDLLSEDGIVSIITPRYFLESISGKHLRNYILNNSYINEIIDFNGSNIFKNISIASCIITLSKKCITSNIDIHKLKNSKLKLNYLDSLEYYLNDDNFYNIKIKQSDLTEDWIISNKENLDIYNKLESYGQYRLKDICISFQGIITGCDKAFIIDKRDTDENIEEKKLLKNWVKNKQIKKYKLDENKKLLIYSNDIVDEEEYPKSINYISNYKEKLLNRRECRKNIRKWYELQWGRQKELFERKKIMYPYKAKENRFAIDYKNSFCSADVYSFYIKEEYENEFSYEYIVGLLNSSIYDTYFKTFAKKMTSDLYDYYPNKVMEIKIFKDRNYNKIENLAKDIITLINDDYDNEILIIEKQKQLDEIINKSIELFSLI
ncbi:MAG: Eco57I restriction-modification methylase domain-containing protein [Peptostreptococcaceae bacterium]|nr:Eco57I restriction-modification methylase domain-containing protein [Peptostreptococcaceae bacterium]